MSWESGAVHSLKLAWRPFCFFRWLFLFWTYVVVAPHPLVNFHGDFLGEISIYFSFSWKQESLNVHVYRNAISLLSTLLYTLKNSSFADVFFQCFSLSAYCVNKVQKTSKNTLLYNLYHCSKKKNISRDKWPSKNKKQRASRKKQSFIDVITIVQSCKPRTWLGYK